MDTAAHILVVDDDRGSRIALSTLLQDEGYEVETAGDGAAALACIRQHPIDLVVSDVQMPGIDGFAVVKRLRRSSKSRDLPVILMSGEANADRRTTGLHLGADDFMAKPLDFDELLARIKTQLRHLQRNRDLLQEIVRDPLTGTLNRRGILEVLSSELKRAQRHESYTSLLMIDLNDFKIINDTRGHAAGDSVLRAVADALRCAVRAHDRVGRLGGDEFLVVLADTREEDAKVLIERLRECTDAASFAIGLATAQGSELPDVLIRKADAAMYRDKGERRRGTWKTA
jgi:diguanylate cyclase (GGDEF)-like protein